MKTIEKIKAEVKHLPSSDLTLFRAWFAEFDAKNWDAQIAYDSASGKLDRLAEKAIKQFKAGRCTSL